MRVTIKAVSPEERKADFVPAESSWEPGNSPHRGKNVKRDNGGKSGKGGKDVSRGKPGSRGKGGT